MRITWAIYKTPAVTVTANEIVIRTCCGNYLLISFSPMCLPFVNQTLRVIK